MTERDYDYTPATIGGVIYRQEKVTLKWRDTADTIDSSRHVLVESVTLYDADDRTWKVTDENGRTTETQYDALGKVAVTIDPFGGRTTYDYDARGDLIRTLYPDGTETRTAYDDMGRVTWQSDRYASGSNPLSGYIDNMTTALASLTVYDDLGQVVQTQRYSGVLFTIKVDDRLADNPGNSILRSDATGGTELSSSTTRFDTAGRPVATTNASGVTTLTTYYDDGRTKNTWQSATGLPVDPGTSYAYDVTDGSGLHREDRVTDALGHETITDYDNLGQATKITYDDGSFSETLYGTKSQAVSRSDITLPDDTGTANDFPSSFQGQHVVKIAQRKSGDPVVATHYLYDTSGHLTDVWQPKVHDAATNTDQWPHWHYDYDAFGNLTAQTDPLGHVTSFTDTFAASGNALYLPGQKITHTRTLPAVSGTTVTETTKYDALGRALSVQDFKGQTVAYDYDDSAEGEGRLFAEFRFAAGSSALDSSNNIIRANAAERTEYSYDALGRQSQIREYADGTTSATTRVTNYAYDPITGAVSLVDSPEGKVHYVYDAATGRLTETWTGTDSSHVSTDTLYGYDQLGRIESVASAKINGSTPSAPATQLSRFNATGQIVSGNTLPTTDYDYDAAGNLDHVKLPNGDVEDYDYDNLNRLTKVTTTNSGSFKLFEQDYTLQPNGQRESVVEKRFSGSSSSPFSTNEIDWTYDDLGRLTGETRDVGQNGPDSSDYRHDFAYDLAGNRLQEKIDNGDNDNTHPDETIAYTYDARDRLTLENSDNDANDVCYSYDANGSMTQKIAGPSGGTQVTSRYLWDLRNRMTAVDGNGDNLINAASDATYGYDEAGQRVSEKKGNASSTTYYLNDKNNPTGYPQIIEEKAGTDASSATFSRSYVIGLSIIGQYDATNGTLYLLKDGHGSTRGLLMSTTGAVGDLYDYQAFGEPIGFDPVANPPKTNDLFGGDAEFDPTSSFYYHDARWRQNFRFISMDDLAGNTSDPLTLHKYLYANGNPINGSDPSGHFDLVQTIVVGAILGAGFGALGSYAAHGSVHVIDVLKGAALGAIALPLAFASPIFGAGLAAFGLSQSWQLTWHVWENPQSSKGQLAASIILLGASMFGTYAAGQNLASNGWYNPSAFSNPPAATGSGLSSASALSQLFEGVPDDAMVHVSRTPLATVASEGVRGSVGTGKSYWFRWGDVKHLTPKQYQSIVGPGAQGGRSDANVFVFKLVNNSNSGLFQLGAKNGISQMQEYEASQTVMPDAGGVTAPNH